MEKSLLPKVSEELISQTKFYHKEALENISQNLSNNNPDLWEIINFVPSILGQNILTTHTVSTMLNVYGLLEKSGNLPIVNSEILGPYIEKMRRVKNTPENAQKEVIDSVLHIQKDNPYIAKFIVASATQNSPKDSLGRYTIILYSTAFYEMLESQAKADELKEELGNRL